MIAINPEIKKKVRLVCETRQPHSLVFLLQIQREHLVLLLAMTSAAQGQMVPVGMVVATVMRLVLGWEIAAETSMSSTAHVTRVCASNY